MTRKLSAVITATGNGWSFNDTVTGESRLIVELPLSNSTAMHNLALYGLKQATTDGGAKSKGTSLAARVAGMEQRYDQIIAGTWNFRDGTGTSGLPDGDVYRAIVGLGIVPDDTADRRAKWKDLKPAQRRAIATRPDVRAWIEANVPTDDADDALAAFME